MGLTYCCCNVAGNLCQTCLGSTAAGTTGRKRSALFLLLTVVLSLWFQYSVGPSIVTQTGSMWRFYRWIPGVGNIVFDAWHEPCQQYKDDPHLLAQCAGDAGVYRPTSMASLFFAASAVAAKVNPDLNRQAWPAKFGIYMFAVAISVFFSSAPWFTGIYLFLARIGATVFLLLQQVILIDLAYNWNEDWVDRADQADRLDYGSGQAWLRLIVGTCAGFYVSTIVGISLLYHLFRTCPSNNWIITLTLLGIIAFTVIQLNSSDGSLLTSSIMSLYVTYLAYSMVSKNPNGHCNPYLGQNDVWGITIGLTLTAVSLAWTGLSWTAEERLNLGGVQAARTVSGAAQSNQSSDEVNLDVPFLDPEDMPTSGLIVDSEIANTSTGGTGLWKLNVVMCLISCFVAMTLTGWGTIERLDENSNAANPTVGRLNMAAIGVSQWAAIGLYVWTILAPQLFPDRDFS